MPKRVSYIVVKVITFQDGTRVAQNMSAFAHPSAAMQEAEKADFVMKEHAGMFLYDQKNERISGLQLANVFGTALGITEIEHRVGKILVADGPVHLVAGSEQP